MIVSSTSLQLGTSNLWFSNIVTTNGSSQFCQNFKHRILFYTNFGLGRISMSWLVSSNKTCQCMARFLSSTLFDVSTLVWIIQEEIPNNPRKMSSSPVNPEYTKWSQRYRRLGWRHLNCSATVIFIWKLDQSYFRKDKRTSLRFQTKLKTSTSTNSSTKKSPPSSTSFSLIARHRNFIKKDNSKPFAWTKDFHNWKFCQKTFYHPEI